MEGFGVFIVLVFLLYYLAVFFTIMLAVRLLTKRGDTVQAVIIAAISLLINFFIFSSDVWFDISVRFLIIYFVVVFFGYILSFTFQQEE
jgi:hypothetical protein